ncbi:vanadium-dependent haloperoxidase [Derxia gummosa]|uniref:Vanadium-dependent haloperoxidase n=1 Tax=Derxia gummosa DSM 723 TaxID=1121388 RepID=A0A8B6X1N5_9BURK|nr:vanadium-dependent haloperoxidase [Derxia gummosa]
MTRFTSRRRLLASATAALAISLSACSGGGGVTVNGSSGGGGGTAVTTQAVTRWSSFVIDLMSELEIAGPIEARSFAMAFIGAHDALNSISPRYARYAVSSSLNQSSANPDAAVAAAMYTVLKNELNATRSGWKLGFDYATKLAELDARYQSELAGIADGNAKTLGISIGTTAGNAIIARRANDGMGAALSKAYSAPTTTGYYQITPDYAEAGNSAQKPFAVGWGDVTPFAMASVGVYALPRPYGSSSNAEAVQAPEYLTDYKEVKAKGSTLDCGDAANQPGVCRTADEKDYANFWYENSSTTWLRLAIGIANNRSMNDWDKARMYALLEMAMSDASVASLYVKYTYQFWRPITAIRTADDGNASTTPDAAWSALIITPPWPDYASVHTGCGSAAAAVLRGVLGSDTISFSASSTTLSGKVRNYTSLTQAETENGNSRIYVGFHFRRAVTDSMTQGNNIGDMTFKTKLTAL